MGGAEEREVKVQLKKMGRGVWDCDLDPLPGGNEWVRL